MVERGEQDFLLEAVLYDHVPGFLLNPGIIGVVSLDLDVGEQILTGGPFTVFLEGGNLLGCIAVFPQVGGIERPQLRIAHVADPAGAVGGAVDALVMVDDEDAVLCHMDIQLDSVRTDLGGFPEGEHGVLRIGTAVPAVCHYFHSGESPLSNEYREASSVSGISPRLRRGEIPSKSDLPPGWNQ